MAVLGPGNAEGNNINEDNARNEADYRRQELQNQQPKLNGKGQQTVVRHRQITPESTPGPDTARNKADKQRQQEEGFAETRPPHPIELDAEEDTPGESNKGTELVKAKTSKGTPRGSKGTGVIKATASKGKEPVKDTSEGSKEARVSIAQREAVDRVLKAPDGWNFQILGLKGLQDAEKVPSAYKRLALQVHPDRNRDPRAGSAFQRIQNAVEALGVEVPPAEEFINSKGQEIDRNGNVINNEEDNEETRPGPGNSEETGPGPGNSEETRHGPGNGESEDTEMTGATGGQTRASQTGASQTRTSQTGASQTGASQTGASQTGASQTRGQPVVSADIEYPWTTGFTAEGDIIIANRPKTRLGKTFGHTCVVETQGERGPLYEFKSGAEIGRLELEEYLSEDGIKTLAEKDKNGNRKVWSYKNKDDFVDVLWFAIAPLHTATEGRGRKDLETLGCVRFRYGLDLLSRSDLVNVIGKKSTKTRIQRYCSKMGLTPPWKVQPDIVRVPRGKTVHKEKTNSENRDSENGDSENESGLTGRLAAIEDKISRRENSLQEMLDKLEKRMTSMVENRMDSMEEKLSKIDELDGAAAGLAANMFKLIDAINKLEDRVGGLEHDAQL
ncbi:MAG: hypothetical protein M1840_005517 [Geoglossum simile]|nr:MAG: hypothetical protein M1840_005517 [Geoglossum simile]